jgi:hypothetical protein
MIVLVLAVIGAAAWAGEPNETVIPLAFEIGPATPGPLGAANQALFGRPVYEPLITYKAVYAAAIPRLEPTQFLPCPGNTSQMMEFLHMAGQQVGLSARQKALLKAAERVYTSSFATHDRRAHPMVDRPDPNGQERVILYAVTLDDAKKMAQAYLQYAVTGWQRQLKGEEEALRKVTDKIAQEEKRSAELDELTQTTQKTLEGLPKTVPYRTESEAHQAIGELDRMLNAAQVEIAGIHARLDRIMGYRKERPPGMQISQDAVAKLDMMILEEDVALQGAAARQKMATSLREQASRFVDLKSTLANAAAEKKTLTESLDKDRKALPGRQNWLEVAKQGEPKIPDKVVIYPVKWVDEPSQN